MPSFKTTNRKHSYPRVHFVYAPSQWETTLHCNVVSHWLGAYTKWSLLSWKTSIHTHVQQSGHDICLARTGSPPHQRFLPQFKCEFIYSFLHYFSIPVHLIAAEFCTSQYTTAVVVCAQSRRVEFEWGQNEIFTEFELQESIQFWFGTRPSCNIH